MIKLRWSVTQRIVIAQIAGAKFKNIRPEENFTTLRDNEVIVYRATTKSRTIHPITNQVSDGKQHLLVVQCLYSLTFRRFSTKQRTGSW